MDDESEWLDWTLTLQEFRDSGIDPGDAEQLASASADVLQLAWITAMAEIEQHPLSMWGSGSTSGTLHLGFADLDPDDPEEWPIQLNRDAGHSLPTTIWVLWWYRDPAHQERAIKDGIVRAPGLPEATCELLWDMSDGDESLDPNLQGALFSFVSLVRATFASVAFGGATLLTSESDHQADPESRRLLLDWRIGVTEYVIALSVRLWASLAQALVAVREWEQAADIFPDDFKQAIDLYQRAEFVEVAALWGYAHGRLDSRPGRFAAAAQALSRREQARRQAMLRVGERAWGRLSVETQEDLRAHGYLQIVDSTEFRTDRVSRLCRSLERELGAALIRDGLPSGEVARNLENRCRQATTVGSKRSPKLQRICDEVLNSLVPSIRNKAAHLDAITQKDLDEVEALVLGTDAARGWIIRLASVESPAG